MDPENEQPTTQPPPPEAGPADAEAKGEGDGEGKGEGGGGTKAEGEPKGEGEGGDGAQADGEGEVEASKPEAPKFEFNFDDEPKKKKKSKKSKKDQKAQKSFSREYYETLILNLNNQLASLRKIFKRKDEVNSKVANELATIEEDRVDVCEHLDRTLSKREIQIIELEETLIKLKKDYNEYKEMSRQRIDELQKLYASTEKQLKGEIQLQERALSSLDEFRVQRDAVLDRYQATHDHVENMERQCKEDLFNLEQKNTVQKNVLKKEVKMRLQQVAEDFLHSSEIRNAGYTRNLIRENITLHKTLDRRVKQNICIMEEREKQFLKTKEVMESYSSLEQFTEHLEHTIENKNAIIKRLTGRIERMKTKFIDSRRYRNLCDKAMQKGLFKKTSPQNLKDMTAHLEQLKTEKFALHFLTYQQEPEIERLNQVLDKLMSALMMAADSFHLPDTESISAMNDSDIEEIQRVLRQNIVAELIPIVSGTTPGTEECHEKRKSHDAVVYRPGSCGFIPTQNNCTDKTITELYDHAKGEMGAGLASKESSSLYGLEFGSYCYYSHTPTIESSSMLSPIEECTGELNELELTLGSLLSSAISSKYKHKRCSCPKKKDSSEVESLNKIIFREPRETWKNQNPMFPCFYRQSAHCFNLDCYPYCSDSSSLQDEKGLKHAKASVGTAGTFVSFQSVVRVAGDKKSLTGKEQCKCD